ncbi:hypothetical protein RGQ21_19550 [Kitasatospora aureofaciens]|nr:hypothetical protein RGQ21_19550 [Kitasatospora aureofaciens]
MLCWGVAGYGDIAGATGDAMVWTRMGLDQFAGPGATRPAHRAPRGLDHPGKGVPKPDAEVPADADREDVERSARG